MLPCVKPTLPASGDPLALVFLGTSAGVPTRERGLSALAVRRGGHAWLVDCGEGTQQRLLRAPVRPTRIDRVLITHLHGDHCWGLPGLLASMGMHGRREPVEVTGPEGLEPWLELTLRTAAVHLPFPLRVREIGAEGGPLDARDGLAVEAWPLLHRVPSFAYVLREAPRRGHVDPARARALGVTEGPLLGRLAAGESVTLGDGRRVAPDAVMGPPRPGRVVVVCGDSADSRVLEEAAPGCDVLVHECTFDAGLADKARRTGHSTTADVAALARRVRPRRLVLTHWSSRYTGEEGAPDVEDLRREVAAAVPGTDVLAAHDLLEVEVPLREAPQP
jgi:ribonuclease Z